jgi:hypothetical protein
MIAAIAAGGASGIIDAMHACSAANGAIGADFEAFAAILAKVFNKTDLGLSQKAFGIRAPLAGQRQPLKKTTFESPVHHGEKSLNIGNHRAQRRTVSIPDTLALKPKW